MVDFQIMREKYSVYIKVEVFLPNVAKLIIC